METEEIEVVMVPAYVRRNIYFIFRSNSEEVEIDTQTKLITNQLSFKELVFIKDNYPFIEIDKYKIKKKEF